MKDNIVKAGQKPGNGCYNCTNCNAEIKMEEHDKMPHCPNCSNNSFKKR